MKVEYAPDRPKLQFEVEIDYLTQKAQCILDLLFSRSRASPPSWYGCWNQLENKCPWTMERRSGKILVHKHRTRSWQLHQANKKTAASSKLAPKNNQNWTWLVSIPRDMYVGKERQGESFRNVWPQTCLSGHNATLLIAYNKVISYILQYLSFFPTLDEWKLTWRMWWSMHWATMSPNCGQSCAINDRSWIWTLELKVRLERRFVKSLRKEAGSTWYEGGGGGWGCGCW